MKLKNYVICFLIILKFLDISECGSRKGKEKVGSTSRIEQGHEVQGYGGQGDDEPYTCMLF